MKRALGVALIVCLLGAAGYGVERLVELRAATAPPTPEAFVQAAWTVYRFGPGHRIHVGGEGLACGACHRTASDRGYDEPGPGVCIDCHEAESSIEHVPVALDTAGRRTDGGAGTSTVTDCLQCHGFGPDPEQEPSDCLRCHASQKGALPAVKTHAQEECAACHDVHENRIQPIACQDCHGLSVRHGSAPQGTPAQCLDCHHAHAVAEVAETSCASASCHGREGTAPVPVSATAAGAHSCTGCHAPHAFQKSEAKPCTSCHATLHPLAGAGHKQCVSCHAPHAVRESVVSQNVCTSCHREVQLVHTAPIAPAAACTGCHTAHPEKKASEPVSCTSCHAPIATDDRAAHAEGVACTGCHTPHDFHAALAGQTSCASCHQKRMSELAGHAHESCAGCHRELPHGGVGAVAPCASCHSEQAGRVHAGHRNCTGCHDPHTGVRPAELCRSCHRAEAEQLSPKHGACEGCHDAHAATPVPQVAACTGCHEPQKLPGLHEVAAHRERCASCHEAHPERAPAAPVTCLTCHEAMKEHQPKATRCSGCHAFRAPPKGNLGAVRGAP